MTKKVYTLTFHDVPNVGAILQAYALQKFLIDSGYRSEIINYRPFYHLVQLLKPTKGVWRNINRIRMYQKTRAFSRENLQVTARTIRDAGGLEALNDAHAVICGSDQIWNPKLTGGRPDPIYFLGADLVARKIAYAASAGGSRFKNNDTEIAGYLTGFHAIGVREKNLELDIRKNGWRSDVVTVLDPTFLIDNYDVLLDPRRVPSTPYIATYEISNAHSRKAFDRYVAKLKSVTGLPVYHLGANPIESADRLLAPVSPGEWLSLIKGASNVCTNSFHGLALSLIFDKKVVFASHIEDEKNARAKGLLSSCNLDDLFYTSPDDISYDKVGQDYNRMSMDPLIESSRRFLINSIE